MKKEKLNEEQDIANIASTLSTMYGMSSIIFIDNDDLRKSYHDLISKAFKSLSNIEKQLKLKGEDK